MPVKANPNPYRSAVGIAATWSALLLSLSTAREYFDSLDLPVEIVPLYSFRRTGPITECLKRSLVSTGRTLKNNGQLKLNIIPQLHEVDCHPFRIYRLS